MGSRKAQTVGYHYKWIMHHGWCAAADAVLAIRAGGVDAWAGRLSANASLNINRPQLWGGEDGEGGMQGYMDVMFGNMNQQPNSFLASRFGPKQSANRGAVTTLWRGGRFGAYTPNPRTLELKIERVLTDWKADAPWYPERARIMMSEDTGTIAPYAAIGPSYIVTSPDGIDWSGALHLGAGDSTIAIVGMDDRYVVIGGNSARYTENGRDFVGASGPAFGGSGGLRGTVRRGNTILHGRNVAGGGMQSDDRGSSFSYKPAGGLFIGLLALLGGTLYMFKERRLWRSVELDGPWEQLAQQIPVDESCFAAGAGLKVGGQYLGQSRILSLGSDGGWSVEALPRGDMARITAIGARDGIDSWVAGTADGAILFKRAGAGWAESTHRLDASVSDVRFLRTHWVIVGGEQIGYSFDDGETWTLYRRIGADFRAVAAADIDDSRAGLAAMNPAHMVYDAITHPTMMGEPEALISDASFRAAADRLYAEGFGLCTLHDSDQETPEEFIRRICNVAGMACSQSRVDGLYYLDLIRGDYDVGTLPVITDNDVMEWEQEPVEPAGQVNCVRVVWNDPAAKDKRTTPPVYSQASIRSAGEVIEATKEFPEIPDEGLALRKATSELNASSRPLSRFRLVLSKRLRALRVGQPARLMCPKHGIADMVVRVGELRAGTHTDGRFRFSGLEDVWGMPMSTHVRPSAGDWVAPDPVPRPSPAQRVLEAPYVELAASLPAAELQALQTEAGFVLATAAAPASGRNYDLATAAAGESLQIRTTGDWAPSAVIDTVDETGRQIGISGGSLLDRVLPGSWALIGEEIVRVDALDVDAGTVTVGRGCADTVRRDHVPGERIFFCGDWVASDTREYVEGDVVDVRLLTRTASDLLALEDAVALQVELGMRAARPYPPGNLRVDGERMPAGIVGPEITITLAHRDRLLQADQLVDDEKPSVGPEPGTQYRARYFALPGGELVHEAALFEGDEVVHEFPHSGAVRLEVHSMRSGLLSWQAAAVTFVYANSAAEIYTTASGEYTTADGDPYTLAI